MGDKTGVENKQILAQDSYNCFRYYDNSKTLKLWRSHQLLSFLASVLTHGRWLYKMIGTKNNTLWVHSLNYWIFVFRTKRRKHLCADIFRHIISWYKRGKDL